MAIKLEVPLVSQRRTNSCWYASACMVAYYREQGPRLGLPERWAANTGIGIADFVRLAKAEGLSSIPFPAWSTLSARLLEMVVGYCGPIWCAGQWDGVPHIVVLTGVADGNVYINDPAPCTVGARRIETAAWFRERLDSHVRNCMLYRRR